MCVWDCIAFVTWRIIFEVSHASSVFILSTWNIGQVVQRGSALEKAREREMQL